MKKVLVINDSRFERLILKDMLNRLGYSVKDTDEFISIRQIDLYDPDVIVVNRNMYDISGLDLIDMIKSKNSKYRCLLSSCSPLKIDAIKSSKADGAFQTPIGVGELQDVIEGRTAIVGDAADENAEEPGAASSEENSSREGGKPLEGHKHAAVARRPAINFCPFCGNDIRHETPYVFCPFCGKKI